MPNNREQWLNNDLPIALNKSNPLQPPKHGFPHCSTMPKTIVRTQKSYPSKPIVITILRQEAATVKLVHKMVKAAQTSLYSWVFISD